MKKISIIAMVILLLGTNPALFAQSKVNYKAFSPSDAGKSVMLKSDSKTYKYFELENRKSIGFEVTGPIRIKIRTRALLPENRTLGEYSVTIWEGDRVRSGRKVNTKASALIVEGSRGVVGVARDIFIRVPKGKHKYAVTMDSDNIDRAFVRFYQEKKKKKKQDYETFRPYEFARREKLKGSKSQISYYFIDDGGGAKIKVIGPTKIKIYCRANFDPTMKEKSKFTLGAFENGESVKKFSAVTEKSVNSVYPKVPEVIPSKLHTFIMDVPDGEHVYEFKKVNSSPNSLAARFKILKSSLGKKK